MKLTKHVIYPGSFLARYGAERKELKAPLSRIRHWADSLNRMVDSGLRIPAPFKHDRQALPVVGTDTKPPKDSRDNAGYWNNARVDEHGHLFIDLEVPDDHPDKEKIGTSIVEVSPFIRPSFTDGLGREWKDVFAHLALVTNPVVPGQKNFESAPVDEAIAADLGFSLSISDLMEPTEADADDAPEQTSTTPPQNIKDVLEALRLLQLDLPEDTDYSNLTDRIVVATRAFIAGKKVGQGDTGTTTEPPNKGSEESPSPIALSIGDTDVITPIQQYAAKQRQADYLRRINSLIASGRVSKKYADDNIIPLVEGYELSLGEDSEPVQQPIDVILGACESIAVGAGLNGTEVKAGKNGKGMKVGFGKNGYELSLQEEGESEDMKKTIPGQVSSARAVEIAENQLANMT